MGQQKRGRHAPGCEHQEGTRKVKRHITPLETKSSLQACGCKPDRDQADEEEIGTNRDCKTTAAIDDRSRWKCRHYDGPGNQKSRTKVEYKQAYRYEDQADWCYGHGESGKSAT